MKITKILSAVLAAALILAGCSDNPETQNNDKESSVSESKNDNSESTVESKPVESSESTTESEAPAVEYADAPEDDFECRPYGVVVEIVAYKGEGGAIRVPKTINGKQALMIGERAFSGSKVTNVILPYGVNVIGNDAFLGCERLASITLSDSVVTIGSCAFSGCESLTDITIPDSVTEIGDGVFDYCKNIQAIYKGETYDYAHINDLYKAING